MQNNSGKLPAAIAGIQKSSGNKWLKGFKRIRNNCQARQISGPVPEGPRHAWLQLISNTVILPGQALWDACLCPGVDHNCCLLPQLCGLHEDVFGSNKGSAYPSSSLQQHHKPYPLKIKKWANIYNASPRTISASDSFQLSPFSKPHVLHLLNDPL